MSGTTCICGRPVIEVLRERYGPIPDECVTISRWYRRRRGRPKPPVWWFDIALAPLKEKKCSHQYLVCKVMICGCCLFHILRVPTKFLLENLDGLRSIERRGEKFIRLWLSAASEDRFTDVVGKAHLSLAEYAI